MKFKYLLIALFFIAQTDFQSPNIEAMNTQVIKTIQLRIREYLLSQHANGSVAVVKKNKVIYNEGIGFANRKTGRANLPSTTFPIGSITKVMVATCIMQLQENGKLNTQDSVSKIIPEFPNGNNIKLIHLLNQTSGIQAPVLFQGNLKSRDIVKEIKIKFSAGTKWDYNDINYFVLGLIVEKVTGESLHKYIEKNIFSKASMHHSGFITEKRLVPYTSTGYIKVGNQVLPAKKLNIAMLFGCGDIYSTALDICLFDEALISGKLLTNQSLQEMLTPGSESKYGNGVYITDNQVFSRGVVGGWESLHVFYKDHTVMAILLNVRDKSINIHQLSRDIKKIIH